MFTRFGRAAIIALFLPVSTLLAQPPSTTDPCRIPQLPQASREANIFSAEQALLLGDVLDTQRPRDLVLVDDSALNARLQAMVDRMTSLAGLPSVRVELIDIPEVNAFTLAGHRVLVARKLVAFAENEDEVAGVLAHELGHVAAADPERTMSEFLRALLDVTAVTDRADIEAKLHRALDELNKGRRVRVGSGQTEAVQEAADRFAVWVMGRAGYAPQAFVAIWTRMNDLQSGGGSWFRDLFGTAKSDVRRLRVTRAAVDAFPQRCLGARAVLTPSYAEWRNAVLEAARTKDVRSAPALHGVISQRTLEPPLRSAVSRLKFSPDGQRVLAQDEGSVYLFKREGLVFERRIDAPDAFHAQFTPDSTGVVFYDSSYRVERWNVETGARDWLHELTMTKACSQSELSPTGTHLMCLTTDFDVRVYDVATGETAFQKGAFYTRSQLAGVVLAPSVGDDAVAEIFQTRFSPDGRYLIIARNAASIGIDLETRSTVSLPASVRERVGLSFSFLSDGRIIGLHYTNEEQSGIVTFPDGQVVAKLRLGRHAVAAPARGDKYVLVNGVAPLAVGVFSAAGNKLIGGSRTAGFDLFDDYYVSESRGGEISLSKIGVEQPLATVMVPNGPMGRLRTFSLSPDFGVVAVSQGSRGAVWNLTNGKGLLVRPFRGASTDGQYAYLDFPRENDAQRAVVRIDPSTQSADALVGIEAPDAKAGAGKPSALAVKSTIVAGAAELQGRYLLGLRARPNYWPSLVVFDATTGTELWSRANPKSVVQVLPGGGPEQVTLVWRYTSPEGKSVVDANPDLATKFEALHAKKEDAFVIEVFNLATGQPQSRFVTTHLGLFTAKRDYVVTSDQRNRTLVFSVATGQQIGQMFGQVLHVAPSADRALVLTERRELRVLSLPSLDVIDTFGFAADIAVAKMNAAGDRLFVLTRDQVAYTLTVGAK